MADVLTNLQIPATLVMGLQVAGILILGLVITRLFGIACSPATSKKQASPLRVLVKSIEYILIISTVFLAVYFLDAGLTAEMFRSLGSHIPVLISTILILILGVMVVNLIMELLGVLLRGIKFQPYLKGVGVDETLLKILLMALRVFLYLVVLQVSIMQLGIPGVVVENSMSAVSYAFTFLLAALIFVSAKDMLTNWLAGFYIKSSQFLKPGQRVFADDADGEVAGFTSFSTILDTGKGYYIAVPHSKLVNRELRIKGSKFELKTLESIRRHYMAQERSMCVPTVIHMILDLFGHPVKGGQKEIAKACNTQVPGGTEPETAIRAVSKLTEGAVAGILVPHKDIIGLRDEIRAWLADDALVVLNFYKAALFPGVKREQRHAVLCVGVEGDDLLIIDPNAETGGVYLVNYKEMERAMGPFEGEGRSYVAYAPRGTRAFWRVQHKLYYSDPVHYAKLSKGVERKLKQVFRESKRVKDVFPESIRMFLDDFKSAESERIERLWKP